MYVVFSVCISRFDSAQSESFRVTGRGRHSWRKNILRVVYINLWEFLTRDPGKETQTVSKRERDIGIPIYTTVCLKLKNK